MPRAPKNISSIAKLRKLLEITQKEFAQFTGLTPASYQQLELGKFPVSLIIALRVMAATGAVMKPTGEHTDPMAEREFSGYDWKGRAYTLQSFEEWKGIQSDKALVAPVAESIKKAIEQHLTFAAAKGNLCEEALAMSIDLVKRDPVCGGVVMHDVVKALTGDSKWFCA